LADEVSLDEAKDEERAAQAARDAGDNSVETLRRLHRARAQVKAAQRARG